MGESESTLSTREMKSVHAGCRRSGRSAWMKRMRWNGVIESGTWLGNSASARSALAQRSHSRWPTSSFCRSAGSAIASIWKAAWFSCAAQGGSWPPVAVPPLRIIEPVHAVGEPISLEERARDGAKDEPLQQRAEGAGPLLRVGVSQLLGVECLGVQVDKHGQREAVHGVNLLQVEQGEEKARADCGDGLIDVALSIERLLQLARLLQLGLDGLRFGFELVQRRDERLVLKDIALRCRQIDQQLLLHVLQLDLQILLCLEQRRLGVLELGLLVLDGQPQQPALEPREGHREVDDGDQRRHVGRDVGRRVARRQHHAERFVVVDHLLADLDGQPRPLSHQVLADHRHQDGLDLVHLLDNERLAEADGQLKRVGEAGLVRRD
eukprot:scaffold5708_cov107-Isochrysis_galbana.AAC.7